MYNLKGSVCRIGETQQLSDSFKKRTFVIKDNSDKYPQTIEFETTQDRTDLLNGLSVGQEVEVTFFLRGREWTGKDGSTRIFNTLDAWKVEVLSGDTKKQETLVEQDDDLPF